MPTTKTRIGVVLNPELEAALRRLSRAMGDAPIATLARSFLEEATPTINDLAEVLEGGKGSEVVRRWQEFVLRLQGQAMELPVEFPQEGDE